MDSYQTLETGAGWQCTAITITNINHPRTKGSYTITRSVDLEKWGIAVELAW